MYCMNTWHSCRGVSVYMHVRQRQLYRLCYDYNSTPHLSAAELTETDCCRALKFLSSTVAAVAPQHFRLLLFLCNCSISNTVSYYFSSCVFHLIFFFLCFSSGASCIKHVAKKCAQQMVRFKNKMTRDFAYS